MKAESGIYVAKVEPDTKGLKEGDIIKAIDGEDVKDDAALRSYLYKNKKPNEEATFKVIRDGKEKEVKLTLKAQKSRN